MGNDTPMLVLGIETTCDETAASVVERLSDGSGRILSNIVRSQTAEHAAFGGVVPEIAARAHVDLLDGIVERAMKEAGIEAAGRGEAALHLARLHQRQRRSARADAENKRRGLCHEPFRC